MKWWMWLLILLFLGGGSSNLSGILGNTSLLLVIGLIWYFSKHRHHTA